MYGWPFGGGDGIRPFPFSVLEKRFSDDSSEFSVAGRYIEAPGRGVDEVEV